LSVAFAITLQAAMARLRDIEIRESAVTDSNPRGWFFHSTRHHVHYQLDVSK
jgi:hypothetical protein